MNKCTKTLAALLLLAAADQASAFTYANTDLLLVFRRDGFNDVEFNLGSVSNYLGKVTGSQLTVANWDFNQTKANFNNNLTGVSMVLMAATANEDAVRRVWLSDGSATGTPTDVSGSKWSQLRSKVDFTGVQAQTFTATNSTQFYVVSPSEVSAYTAIASNGGTVDGSTLGGLAAFPVEGILPGTVRLFELKANNANPKPAAQLIGSFALSAGNLVFTAGEVTTQPGPIPAARITGVARLNSTTTVSFTTTNGANYRLRYAATLAPGLTVTNWTALGNTVAGNGTAMTLQDTAADDRRFYSVEAFR